MSDIEPFVASLREHVPGALLISDAEALRIYAVDGVTPRLLVTPSAVEQAAQVVALAHQQRLTVLPRGGGSRMNLGGIPKPEQIDVLLETTSLTRLLEHEAPDLTCHVEAGLTLAALQAQLATKGQWLALDPPDAQQATLGGILASNASGPKRLRYGSARDLVIGLHVVQASGEVARSGGRVVKNVAGYDLNKLYTGSLGTLGIIVEANFKLHPLPAAERTLLLTFVHVGDAMQMVLSILGSLVTPSALELVDPGAASSMNSSFGLHLPVRGYTVAVNCEGNRSTVDRQVDEVHLLARKGGVIVEDDLADEEQSRFWDAVRAQTRGTVTCKVAVLVSRVTAYLEAVEHICRNHELEATIVAHAGNGILYIELRPTDAIFRLVAAITELRQHARKARGSLVIERCPTELKRHISVWGEPGSEFSLMERLKQRFDATGTFVKGRFVGGL